MGAASGCCSLPWYPVHRTQLWGRAHLQVALCQVQFKQSWWGEAVVPGGSTARFGGCWGEEGLFSHYAGKDTAWCFSRVQLYLSGSFWPVSASAPCSYSLLQLQATDTQGQLACIYTTDDDDVRCRCEPLCYMLVYTSAGTAEGVQVLQRECCSGLLIVIC